MKGQKLFVRPREAADREALARFFAAERAEFPESTWAIDGVLAKLAGEIVAHIAIQVTAPDELWIEHIHVARELRRKRVGRVAVAELEPIAVRLGCRRLVVRKECPAREFFLRLGFSERDGRLEKELGSG